MFVVKQITLACFFIALFHNKCTQTKNVLLICCSLVGLVNPEQVNSSDKNFHTSFGTNDFYFLICCRKWHLTEEGKSRFQSKPILWGGGGGALRVPSCVMGTTGDEMASVEQNASLNPLCFECGQQHWTRENHLYNYQNEVDDDLVCHICLQPLLQPLDTPCGHTFCYKCLRNFLQEKDFCPLDRKRLHFKLCKKSSILVHKLLDKLFVLCPFSSVCQEVMQRCDLAAHLKNRWAMQMMALVDENLHT